MAKINILESSVYNRIAAGEVVERPASVVKEFVENSIDAGAKNISVWIERGGKDLIRVADDGEGIEAGELRSAFLPHATSKIARAEDLERIETLGFRGEALASIASVANVRLCSRFRGAQNAYGLVCTGGKLGEPEPCAQDAGTDICAENLFFNTPVREKFLKTDKGEESEVTAVVSRFILGNPQIAFRYFIDGKPALQSFGGGEEEALAAVYGGAAVRECYRIDAEKHGIRIRGFLGKPSYTKPNRTYQSAFVNGRFVINNTISSAISNAYAAYLMKRQYPFYVLFIDVPAEVVDVNVHPNKSDVRFSDNRVIYGCIYSVVSSILDGNAGALSFLAGSGDVAAADGAESKGREEAAPVQSVAAGQPSAPFGDAARPVGLSDELLVSSADQIVFERKKGGHYVPRADQWQGGATVEFRDSASGYGDRTGAPSRDGDPDPVGAVRKEVPFPEVSGGEAASSPPAEDVFAENKRFLAEEERKAKQQKLLLEQAVYKGNLFNTYLIFEVGDEAYLIDQHAAHERLLFDKLSEEMASRSVAVQPMLLPFVLNVSGEEAAFLREHLDTVNAIGFEIEEFGVNNFKISAVPADLREIDLRSFFDELLKEVGSLRAVRLPDVLRDKIAMTACKHAVKGGEVLTESERRALFARMGGDMGLRCPHGRPVAVRLTKQEVEKLFKRIV